MSEHLRLTPDELLTTTRAVRKRLDFTRPVERTVLEECLTIAQQAPSGSNIQNWHFVVVTDPAKRRALADVYRQGWAIYVPLPIAAGNLTFDDPTRNAQQARIMASGFLVSSAEPASARYSRERDRANRISVDRPHEIITMARPRSRPPSRALPATWAAWTWRPTAATRTAWPTRTCSRSAPSARWW